MLWLIIFKTQYIVKIQIVMQLSTDKMVDLFKKIIYNKSMDFFLFFRIVATESEVTRLKNLEQLTDKEKAFYLAKRAYAARWRKKNADKIKEYQENFYLKQVEEKSISIPT